MIEQMKREELFHDIFFTRLELLQKCRSEILSERPLGFEEMIAGIDSDLREVRFLLDSPREENPIITVLKNAVAGLEAS